MKEMNNLKKYKRGIITIEIQSHIPEKFINLLWKNGVQIKNIRKESITTMLMDISLRDYSRVEEVAQKTKTKIKVVGRKGFAFFLIKMRRRTALVGGVVVFVFILYYLSGFIWKIDIETENNLSPYEIRQQLTTFGIMPGIKKNKIDVYKLQENMIKSNENVMYFKARIEGARLYVSAVEKVTPPKVVQDNTPSNLVAKKDGQIVRVFTSAGSAAVKTGDTVKAGQVVVKGEQGKVGSTYVVHAKGNVIAKTFYEEIKTVTIKGVKKERTGNEIENTYIKILGKKLYIKNSLNKFKSYDKIEENDNFFKREIYYEVKETTYNLNLEEVVKTTSDELYEKILQSLDKSVIIKDKKVESQLEGDNCRVRVLIIAEEDIAVTEQLQ
jgi:similar to stage IV sporulation protein